MKKISFRRGIFYIRFSSLLNTASSAAPQIPLCRRMQGPELTCTGPISLLPWALCPGARGLPSYRGAKSLPLAHHQDTTPPSSLCGRKIDDNPRRRKVIYDGTTGFNWIRKVTPSKKKGTKHAGTVSIPLAQPSVKDPDSDPERPNGPQKRK